MAHLQNWFGLLTSDIATIFPWSQSLDKPLCLSYQAVITLDYTKLAIPRGGREGYSHFSVCHLET